VGDYVYIFEENDESKTSEFSCTSGCIYHR
jgi:hypothetical protein